MPKRSGSRRGLAEMDRDFWKTVARKGRLGDCYLSIRRRLCSGMMISKAVFVVAVVEGGDGERRDGDASQ